MKDEMEIWLAAYSFAYALVMWQQGPGRSPEDIDMLARRHADRVVATYKEKYAKKGKG